MPEIRIPGGYMLVGGDYKPGDPQPNGYLDRQDWAEVQMKAGLRQRPCAKCSKWCFPQQLSGDLNVHFGKDSRGRMVRVETPICKACRPKVVTP